MGLDVMAEVVIPCPCGNGEVRKEIVEHDVWSSGRHQRGPWITCPTCKEQFEILHIGRSERLIERRYHEDLIRRQEETEEIITSLKNDVEERYLAQWEMYVTKPKTKIGRHRAIAGLVGAPFRPYSTVAVASNRDLLRTNILRVLERLGVVDREVESRLEEIDRRKAADCEFAKNIPGIDVPPFR